MCDDGNQEDGDGCSSDCQYEEAQGLLGLWECQARSSREESGGGEVKFDVNSSLPGINSTDLVIGYASAEEAAAVSPDLCRRDVCKLVEGLSISAAEETAQAVTTG